MGIIGRRGFVFSLDLAVAFIAVLLMVSLMLMHLEMEKERELRAFEGIELQRNAIFLLDSLVNNRDEKRPLLGSAFFDAEKRRVMQNEIDLELLKRAGGMELDGFFVSSVAVGEEKIVFAAPSKECIALDRIVSSGGKMAKLGVVVCER